MIRHRLEVWTSTGEKRRAIFSALYKAERRQVLQAEEQLTAEVSAQDGALSSLTSGAVLRLQREGSATTFSLWRLTGRGKTRDQADALRYQITADALWMDIRHGVVRQRLIDGRSQYTFGLNGLTPRQWLEDFILPGYEGTAVQFRLGVVAITDPVDLSFERTNPLAALRMLEGAAEGEAQFRLDPSGEFYHVDFLERIGAEQGTAELRYGKNLTGLERLEDETDVETRLYAVGSGLLTLADAEWRISSLSGSTSARAITFDGPSPVHEDGAFVGLWLSVAAKGRYPITASIESTGRITVNGSGLPALSAGDIGHLVTDAEGTRLDYLESPAGRADYGVRTGDYPADDVPDAVNQVPNSDLAQWSSGLPTGWARLGAPTVTQEADRLYAQQGERAARIVAMAADQGLLSPAFSLSNPADRPYTALLAGLTLVSGSVRLELRRQGGETYPIGERPVLIDLGVYSTMTAGPVHDEPIPAGTYQVAVIAHGAAAEWVLDCAMVTPVIGEEVPAYVSGSGAHLLWERTAWELEERRRPRVEWRIDIADLYRVDPTAFRFDELRMGDSAPVRDPEFPHARPRIVELIQDILDARATQVVLADSARMRVHDPFRPPSPALGGRRAGIGRRSTGTEGAAVLQIMRRWDPITGQLTLGALGTPVVAMLELRTRTSPDDPWVLASTITGRQGWFSPLTPTDDLLIQVTPRDGRGVAGEAVEDTWARGKDGKDGQDGEDGQDGFSVRWRGEFANPPANPQINDAYRNTTDGIVYIYTGSAWEVMAHDGDDGIDGVDGGDGRSVYITYHDNALDDPPARPTGAGTTDGWHTDSTVAVKWLSQKLALSPTDGEWGDPMPWRGETGDPGTPATSYWLVPGAAAIRRDQAGGYTPSQLQIVARHQLGQNPVLPYYGRIEIHTLEGGSPVHRYTSTSDEPGHIYALTVAGMTAVRVRLYAAGGTSTLLHEEVVPVVLDGQKGEPGGAADAPPTAAIRLESVTGAAPGIATLRITGRSGAGTATGLQYDYRVYYADSPTPDWPDAWAALPAPNGTTAQRVMNARRHQVAEVRVRDAAGLVSIPARVDLPPTDLATIEDVDDRAVQAQQAAETTAAADATSKAGAARAGAVQDSTDRMEGRGLRDDGFDGPIGRGAGARTVAQVIDRTDRADAGFTVDARLRTGVEPSADIAGLLRADVAMQQVQQPSQNLMPAGSAPGAERSWTSESGYGPDLPYVALSDEGLSAGDVVSVAEDLRGPAGVSIYLRLHYYDGDRNQISFDTTGAIVGTSYQRAVLQGRTIPAGTVYLRVRVWAGSGSGTRYRRRATLTRGPIALPFEQPPFRPGRGEQITETMIEDDAVTTPKVRAGAIIADHLDVGTLSAVSADLGEITAGIIRGADDGLVVDATGRAITVRDLQPTPVERVRMGRLGSGERDWGLHIRDAEGRLILDASGNIGTIVNVPKRMAIVEAHNGMLWPYGALYDDPPLVAYIGGGVQWDSRHRWGTIEATRLNGGKGTGSAAPPSTPYGLSPRFTAEIREATKEIYFHCLLAALGTPTPESVAIPTPAATTIGGLTGAAAPSSALLPGLGDAYTARYRVAATPSGLFPGNWRAQFRVEVDLSTNSGGSYGLVGAKWSNIVGSGGLESSVTDEIEFVGPSLKNGVRVRLRLRDFIFEADGDGGASSVLTGIEVAWQRDAGALYASATPTDGDRARFLVMAQR